MAELPFGKHDQGDVLDVCRSLDHVLLLLGCDALKDSEPKSSGIWPLVIFIGGMICIGVIPRFFSVNPITMFAMLFWFGAAGVALAIVAIFFYVATIRRRNETYEKDRRKQEKYARKIYSLERANPQLLSAAESLLLNDVLNEHDLRFLWIYRRWSPSLSWNALSGGYSEEYFLLSYRQIGSKLLRVLMRQYNFRLDSVRPAHCLDNSNDEAELHFES